MSFRQKILTFGRAYLKTDISYLAKGGFWLTTRQLIVSLSALVLTILLANFFDKETYGNYQYLLSILGLVSLFTLNGMSTAVTQSSARGFEQTSKKALKTSVSWGLLGAAVTFGLAIYYGMLGNRLLSIGLIIIAIATPFFGSFALGNAVLTGQKKFRLSAKYEIITRLSVVGATIIALLLTQNIFIVLLTYLFGFLLVRLIVTLRVFRAMKDTPIDKECIPYGKHLTVMNILWTITKYIDKVLIFHYMGAAELAVYSFAIAPPEYLSTFLGNIQSLVLPKFSSGDEKKIKQSLPSKMLIWGLFISAAIVLYIVISPFLYHIFFPQYEASIRYSQLYSISLIALINLIPLALIQAKKKVAALYRYNTIVPLFSICVLAGGVHYGIIGIIVARIISRMLNLLFIISESRKV